MLRQAVARQRLCGRGGQRPKALRGTVDHGNWHLRGDAPPILPAVELRKIVSAHDPDKVHAGDPAPEMDDRIDSVANVNDSFETADIDARIVRDFPRGLSAFG